MTVPTTKAELLEAVVDGHERLARDLDRVPAERARDLTMPGHVAGSMMSPADLVAYLIGWNELVLRWHRQRDAGREPSLPAEGFAWNQLGQLAHRFYADCSTLSWEELLIRFERANHDIVALIRRLSDRDLYGANWYGTYTAGRMIQLNTSSPYANARRRLRAWLRENGL